MNLAIIIGRLTRDVELRYTPNGIAVANFTVAVDRNYGEGETDFIPVVVWRKLAENCANYIGKGRLVAVQGRIQVSSWDGESGRRYKTEIYANTVKFLDKKPEAHGNEQGRGLLDGAVDVTDELPNAMWGEINDVPF